MLRQIIQEEIPDAKDFSLPLADLAIDSFGLIVLRGRIEAALGRPVSDDAWDSIENLNDMLALSAAEARASSPQTVMRERRRFTINMPQMAMQGLSESWLLKELGDMHWSMITRGLGSPSSALRDGNGNRLYATFTRIKYAFGRALGAIGENTSLELLGKIVRFGAGTFVSDIALLHVDVPGEVRLMSNFSTRGEITNTSLLKSQPTIPPDCTIPDVPPPGFMLEYRDRRAASVPPALFETEYEIIPFHDINGVGLLYFASYPIISDTCSLRYEANFAARSTISRDICYFANADPRDTLVFRIHKWEQSGATLNAESSLSRRSDGRLMAYVVTRKSSG